MADIKVFQDQFSTDFKLSASGDLEMDSSLETAVTLSLFSDARAAGADALPSNDPSRRGWWGDTFSGGQGIGSKLWLLSRGKLTDQALLDARSYALDALAWLVEDGVAGAVEVAVDKERLPSNTWVLVFSVVITRGSVVQLQQRYGYAWEGV